jgi:hypothetical protein
MDSSKWTLLAALVIALWIMIAVSKDTFSIVEETTNGILPLSDDVVAVDTTNPTAAAVDTVCTEYARQKSVCADLSTKKRKVCLQGARAACMDTEKLLKSVSDPSLLKSSAARLKKCNADATKNKNAFKVCKNTNGEKRATCVSAARKTCFDADAAVGKSEFQKLVYSALPY